MANKTAAEREAGAKKSQARHDARRVANEARRDANIAALGALYDPRRRMEQPRYRTRVIDGKPILTLVQVEVSMPPSRQLERAIHQGRIHG